MNVVYWNLFVYWIRQSSTIFGLSIFVGTTIALATKQISLGSAEAGYGTALTAMAFPQHVPASKADVADAVASAPPVVVTPSIPVIAIGDKTP